MAVRSSSTRIVAISRESDHNRLVEEIHRTQAAQVIHTEASSRQAVKPQVGMRNRLSASSKRQRLQHKRQLIGERAHLTLVVNLMYCVIKIIHQL